MQWVNDWYSKREQDEFIAKRNEPNLGTRCKAIETPKNSSFNDEQMDGMDTRP
jgi:hypothetical protein